MALKMSTGGLGSRCTREDGGMAGGTVHSSRTLRCPEMMSTFRWARVSRMWCRALPVAEREFVWAADLSVVAADRSPLWNDRLHWTQTCAPNRHRAMRRGAMCRPLRSHIYSNRRLATGVPSKRTRHRIQRPRVRRLAWSRERRWVRCRSVAEQTWGTSKLTFGERQRLQQHEGTRGLSLQYDEPRGIKALWCSAVASLFLGDFRTLEFDAKEEVRCRLCRWREQTCHLDVSDPREKLQSNESKNFD